MPGTAHQFVDFSVNTAGDTGENNASSIQPIANGEALNQTVLQRPDESLRQRTEAVRSVMMDSLYLRDADRVLLITGPGKVTWPGSTTASASGIPVVTDNVWILPMLSPGYAQTPPIPPVASAYGTLHLKRADSLNSILVTSQRRSYAAGDQINVTVTSGGSFSCTLDTETTFQRTIKIVATGSTTLTTVIGALNALTPLAPDNTALVTAVLENGALGSDLILTTQAKQYVAGNYDGEGHTITPANLASFFSGSPSSALAEGDTLCVQYDMVADTASTGGRRQALPENSNTTIPTGSFFNSRLHPEKLANALPICKVVNGALVFATGVEVPAGSTAFALYGNTAANISYAGGPNWADGGTNPATTVEAQLDKIITDLTGANGTSKINGVSYGSDLGAYNLSTQIGLLAAVWWKRDRGNTDAGTNTFSGVNTFTNANIFSGDNTFSGPQEYQGDFQAQIGTTEQLDRGGLHSPVGSRFRDDFHQFITTTGSVWSSSVTGTGSVSGGGGQDYVALGGGAASDSATVWSTSPISSWSRKPMLRMRAEYTPSASQNSRLTAGIYDVSGTHQVARFIQDKSTYGSLSLRIVLTNNSASDTTVDTTFVPTAGQYYWLWIIYNSTTSAIWRISDALTGGLQQSGTITVGSGTVKTSAFNLFYSATQSGTDGGANLAIDVVDLFSNRL